MLLPLGINLRNAGNGASLSESTYRCYLPILAGFTGRLPRSSRRFYFTRAGASGARTDVNGGTGPIDVLMLSDVRGRNVELPLDRSLSFGAIADRFDILIVLDP